MMTDGPTPAGRMHFTYVWAASRTRHGFELTVTETTDKISEKLEPKRVSSVPPTVGAFIGEIDSIVGAKYENVMTLLVCPKNRES